MSQISRALVIADPWIGMILDGSKTWEMRSRATTIRGTIGLIRKGTGAVWGVADLSSCGDPLSHSEMIAQAHKHRIPEAMIRRGEVAKWNRPWELFRVRVLKNPVPYVHKPGAVTWVALDPDVIAAIHKQLAA